jgi:hypothetical protein
MPGTALMAGLCSQVRHRATASLIPQNDETIGTIPNASTAHVRLDGIRVASNGARLNASCKGLRDPRGRGETSTLPRGFARVVSGLLPASTNDRRFRPNGSSDMPGEERERVAASAIPAGLVAGPVVRAAACAERPASPAPKGGTMGDAWRCDRRRKGLVEERLGGGDEVPGCLFSLFHLASTNGCYCPLPSVPTCDALHV